VEKAGGEDVPSNMEIRVYQKTNLYDLLVLKREMKKEGCDIKWLNQLINKNKAAMEAEDVAYVEKTVAELE
jgi:hypothetical protein